MMKMLSELKLEANKHVMFLTLFKYINPIMEMCQAFENMHCILSLDRLSTNLVHFIMLICHLQLNCTPITKMATE